MWFSQIMSLLCSLVSELKNVITQHAQEIITWNKKQILQTVQNCDMYTSQFLKFAIEIYIQLIFLKLAIVSEFPMPPHICVPPGSYDQNIQLYNVETHDFITNLCGHLGTVTTLIISLSGRFMFSASHDCNIQVGWRRVNNNKKKSSPFEP